MYNREIIEKNESSSITLQKQKLRQMSTDELIQTIYWSRDRRAYRRACNINAPADAAADNAFESACYAELDRRGVDRF